MCYSGCMDSKDNIKYIKRGYIWQVQADKRLPLVCRDPYTANPILEGPTSKVVVWNLHVPVVAEAGENAVAAIMRADSIVEVKIYLEDMDKAALQKARVYQVEKARLLAHCKCNELLTFKAGLM